tara:strand:+ start:230 stop:433 length:204 start_codon:yes stop_codon:yes gene_type:complete
MKKEERRKILAAHEENLNRIEKSYAIWLEQKRAEQLAANRTDFAALRIEMATKWQSLVSELDFPRYS